MRKRPVFLIILLIILALTLIYLGYTYNELKKQSEIEKAELERQKTNLEDELKSIYSKYDSLKSENDTMNLKLLVEQQRIERLLKINANNVYKIRMYEKELETIRKVLRSYIYQIDSLNQANIALRTENIEVRQQLRRVEKEKEDLTQVKEELETKVEIASVINAKNITVTPLNKRSKENLKADRVEKLQTCLTLRENAIIPPGNKIVYLRIARPDDVILTSGVNLFEFEGEQIVYTASREVQYENVDVDLCIFWTNDGQLIPGNYRLNLYCDGKDIGSTTFSLK
ncbi:MAG: hypothetical protein AMS27_03865 [Bacteroides sp. SM23_62_1]|nr:MAG: hypothetical protein AMS27_03865 [Bacteroides sp. SM23_62_1]